MGRPINQKAIVLLVLRVPTETKYGKENLLSIAESQQMKQIRERMKKWYWIVTRRQLDGIGVIEIILILVIIIGLVLIFRNQIEGIMKTAFSSITGDAAGINKDINVKP